MSIHQLNMYGLDMVEVAIERLKAFEPEEGYFLAFSGGKDSVTVKKLADLAGVKYDAHYNVTSVDPPELVRFVKTFPDVRFDFPKDKDGHVITMWNLIPTKRMPPTRKVRYCCAYLKEGQGADRFVVTGVRKDESVRRAQTRGGLELGEYKTTPREKLDPDNPTPEMMYHCQTYRRKVLNPIFDWTTDEVWEFIKEYEVPYCELYDEGYERLGCIGCPMAGEESRKREFERYPKYKEAYIRAFQKMIDNNISEGGVEHNEERRAGVRAVADWYDGSTAGIDVFDWWILERE